MRKIMLVTSALAFFGFAGAAAADGGPDGSNDAPFTIPGYARPQAVDQVQNTRSVGYPSVVSRWQKTTVHPADVSEGYGVSVDRIKSLTETENNRLNYWR